MKCFGTYYLWSTRTVKCYRCEYEKACNGYRSPLVNVGGRDNSFDGLVVILEEW